MGLGDGRGSLADRDGILDAGFTGQFFEFGDVRLATILYAPGIHNRASRPEARRFRQQGDRIGMASTARAAGQRQRARAAELRMPRGDACPRLRDPASGARGNATGSMPRGMTTRRAGSLFG